MFSKYFISTLVFIIVSIAVLFQGEIKEGYSKKVPTYYENKMKRPGLIADPYFSYFGGKGVQLTEVEVDPIDKQGNLIEKLPRTLGYQKPDQYTSTRRTTPTSMLVNPSTAMKRAYSKPGQVEAALKPVQVEAARNIKPMGPGPRFQTIGPKYNLTDKTSDQAVTGVDNLHPITNYGGQLHSSAGQVLREPFDMPVGKGMISLAGQPAQPVVIDRTTSSMYSNIKSPTQRGGVDRIRGDLHIVPDSYKNGCGGNGWFQVSAKPGRDTAFGYLQQHMLLEDEFVEFVDASGIDTDLFDYGGSGPVADVTLGMPTFGPDSSLIEPATAMGRSNPTTMRFGGGDVVVGSYGN